MQKIWLVLVLVSFAGCAAEGMRNTASNDSEITYDDLPGWAQQYRGSNVSAATLAKYGYGSRPTAGGQQNR